MGTVAPRAHIVALAANHSSANVLEPRRRSGLTNTLAIRMLVAELQLANIFALVEWNSL